MSRSALIAIFACAACAEDSNAPPPPTPPTPMMGTYQSGYRLRARIYDAGGGATIFRGWHDQMLDLDCSFAVTPSGDYRCLPTGVGVIGYLDSNCQQVAYASNENSPPSYVAANYDYGTYCGEDPAAPQVAAAYAPGAKQPPVAVYEKDASGNCVISNICPGCTVWAVDEVPMSTFVRAERVTEARGASLDIEIYVAEDGARQLGRVLDHRNGVACGALGPIDGYRPAGPSPTSLLCVPLARAYDGAYTSATCTCAREAYAPSEVWAPSGCNPTIAVNVDSWIVLDGSDPMSGPPGFSYCGGGVPQVFDLGPRDPAPSPYFWAPNQVPDCWNVPLSSGGLPDFYFYPEVGPADLSRFPSFAETHVGSGRLKAVMLTAADDSRAVAPEELLANLNQLKGPYIGFFDEQRGQPCGVVPFSDGVLRCVTEGTAQEYGQFFSDSACTQVTPTLAMMFGSACPSPTEAIFTSSDNYDVRSVIGPYQGPIYSGDMSGCYDVTAYWPPAFVVGGPIDADAAFPRVIERTE